MEVEGGEGTETPSRSDADRLVLALASLFSLFFDHISVLPQYRCESFAPVLALGIDGIFVSRDEFADVSIVIFIIIIIF